MRFIHHMLPVLISPGYLHHLKVSVMGLYTSPHPLCLLPHSLPNLPHPPHILPSPSLPPSSLPPRPLPPHLHNSPPPNPLTPHSHLDPPHPPPHPSCTSPIPPPSFPNTSFHYTRSNHHFIITVLYQRVLHLPKLNLSLMCCFKQIVFLLHDNTILTCLPHPILTCLTPPPLLNPHISFLPLSDIPSQSDHIFFEVGYIRGTTEA